MPRVSIALPVHNGGRFVSEAIESLLAQSFEDFELVISDNASTDETEEICRAFAESDPRIRYSRTDEFLGAAENFRRAYELSSCGYFRWAAHDDLCEPTFLEKCVAVLDADPGIVLAYSKVRIIDEAGDHVSDYDFEVHADCASPPKRLRGQIRGHQCFEIFGLFRREILEQTPLIEDYFAGDAVLLIRIGLLGRLHEIPEYLFFSRQHPGQSEHLKRDVQKYSAWFRTGTATRITLPYWRVLREYLSSVRRADLSLGERVACFLSVGRWTVARRRPLLRDLFRASVQVAARPFASRE